MGFGTRVAALWSALLLLSFAVLTAFTWNDLRDSLRQQQDAALRTVSVTLRSTLDRNGGTALAMAQMIALQPGNIAALAANDRAAIIELTRSMYEYLAKQNGVTIFQFQTADLKMLARLYDLPRFGDDIANIRPMVVAANRSRQGQFGIEIGPTGILSLRGVAPMMQGATLVGTSEVGFGVPGLIRAVKTRTGAEIAIVLSAAMAGGVQQKDKKAYGDLVLSEATDNALFGRLLEAAPLRLAREDAFSEVTVDGVPYGLVVTPLLDFSGRMIGGVVGALNMSAMHTSYQRQVLRLVFIALGGVVLCFSVITVAMRAFVFRPLAATADGLEAVVEGRATSLEPAGGSAEIDRLARAAATLAARAAPPASEAAAETKEPQK